MKAEKEYKPFSGYLMILLILVSFIGSPILSALDLPIIGVPLGIIAFICLAGFRIVSPNNAQVLVLFGRYVGTIKENGFYWVNPFFYTRNFSLRARNFESETLKVNDSHGNPIMINIILVWRVENTFKAAFDVDDYINFVKIQSDSAVRKLAGAYPYDNFDDSTEITLRSGMNEVNHKLEEELTERLSISGIQVMEARIAHLAYATEIAGAMLKRQQATAIISARQKIVEGAVGMVEMALAEISKKSIAQFDEEKKASMVSNLMVILCSDKDASPVVNVGS